MENIQVTNMATYNRKCGQFFLPSKQPVKVPIDFIASYGLDRNLAVDLTAVKDSLATEEGGALYIDWWSPLSGVDGYGRHAIDMARGLRDLGVRINLRDVGWVDNDFLPADIKHWRAQSYYKVPSKIGVAFTLGYDPQIYQHPSPIRIALTQFETNHLPRVHTQNVNKCDHLIVTSSFQVKMMLESGIKVPIDVMTAGVNTDYFQYRDRPKNGLFKVLILGALTDRKNPLGAVRIFQRASEGNPDWRLMIKTRLSKGTNKVANLVKGDSRITMVTADVHPDQVLQYYYNHDVLLWPSKSEGVGLPPLEAMSTGMELVCSYNSGMMDYVDSNHCYPIRTAGTESAASEDGFSKEYTEAYGEVGEWWLPDEDHAVEQLKQCFNAWYKGKGKGQAGANYVRQHHTLKHQAESIKRVLERYQ